MDTDGSSCKDYVIGDFITIYSYHPKTVTEKRRFGAKMQVFVAVLG